MTEVARAECTIRVGSDAFLQSDSPHGPHRIVFEDDERTGYVYACRTSGEEFEILDALHLYDADNVSDHDRQHRVVVEWSPDGGAAAVLINHWAHAMIDFDAHTAMCVSEFPPPGSRSPFGARRWDEEAFRARFPHLQSEWAFRQQA
jgi:hypothetical protein